VTHDDGCLATDPASFGRLYVFAWEGKGMVY